MLVRTIILIAFVAAIGTSCKKSKEHTTEEKKYNVAETSNLISGIIEEIVNNYVDDVKKDKLEIGAINGMLSSLDDYSAYIGSDEVTEFSRNTHGEFLGVGIEIKQTKEGVEIESVIDESPAFAAGIRQSDTIICIDGVDVSGMSMKKIISKLTSDLNMRIKLTVLRNKSEKFDAILKKSLIQLKSVKVDFISDVAILRITHFNDTTVDCVSRAINEIINKKLRGVILDIRNNPGGILEQSIKICDLFLSNKKIVEFRSRKAEDTRSVFAGETDRLNGLPLVVLVDRNTASGAELVAAALGENKRAVLVGEKTYGKGAMQTVIPIPGHGAIKLTTEYFLSPNGNMIDRVGVIPDIEIQNATEAEQTNAHVIEPIVQRAMDVIHGISALNKNSPIAKDASLRQ
jgi:carboxyl-terminal processing protease